jgi:hypothetical protein
MKIRYQLQEIFRLVYQFLLCASVSLRFKISANSQQQKAKSLIFHRDDKSLYLNI